MHASPAIVGLHLRGGVATAVGAFGEYGAAGVRCPARFPVQARPYARDPVLEWVKHDVWTRQNTRTGESYRSRLG